MYKTTLILIHECSQLAINVPMCHASGSKGIQPHNIRAYRMVYEIIANEGCAKHQNMQILVKLPLL